MALHTHRGTRAVQRLVEFAPSTGGLALWMHHRDDAPAAPTTPAAPRARAEAVAPVSTDGHTLHYAPGFTALSLPVQAGAVAHALLHVALRHPQRLAALQNLTGDVDAALFNVCADAIVNSALSHLVWIELPADAVRLEALLQRVFTADTVSQAPDAQAAALHSSTLSPDAALAAWDVESLYRAVDDRRPVRSVRQAGGSGQQQPSAGAQGQKPSQVDAKNALQTTTPAAQQRPDGPRASRARALGAATARDLLPAPGSAQRPEDEAEAAREWSERLERAHTGDGEFSLLRALLADLPRVNTPWEQVLRHVLARALVNQPGLSWSRPSRSYLANQGRTRSGRRMPWEPGTTPSRAVPRMVLMVDVSGSIDDTLLQRFTREIEALVRRLGAALTLVIGDDRVRQVLRFEPGRTTLAGIDFAGGGGTDFTPLLEEAHRHRPDIGVLLTDLDGGTRFQPPWPLVWAVPESLLTAGEPVLPFGRLLKLR